MTTEIVARATQILFERTARVVGQDFFRALARGLAETMGTRYGMVAEVADPQARAVRTLAIWKGDGFADNFEYSLEGTPCAGVLEGKLCHYPSGVAAAFPDDTMLVEMGIESYLGIPILGPDDRRLGILVALHDQPTQRLPDIGGVLALFADRAAVELERTRFESDLARSEARYRKIVSTCLEGVWVIDRDATTTFVNARMADMLGYDASEMLGQPLTHFMDEEARAQAETNLSRRQDGVAESHEFRLMHRDGRAVWTVMATNPLVDEAGAYEGALALVRDVTATRAEEAHRQEAQRLESLGVLAGGVAHDFNNLLVGVLGNADLALRALERPGPDVETIRATLTDVRAAALRCAELTRQLLAFSGRGNIVLTRVDVEATVRDMVRLVRPALATKTRLRVSPAIRNAFVEADSGQLSQIVMNLVLNASQALNGADGTVDVRTSILDVAAPATMHPDLPVGRYVLLEVADSGVGIEPGKRSRIFDPFFTTKPSGRGLGLAAVLGAVRAHRGEIRVASEVGKGTTFSVFLPATTPPERADPVRLRPPPPSSAHVLVVDDERVIRGILRQILEAEGHVVLEAADGLEAIDMFRARSNEIDLVLLDMTMPTLSGAQTFVELQSIDPSVRVIVSSGYAAEQANETFATSTLAGFLQKPWTPTEVETAVREALRR